MAQQLPTLGYGPGGSVGQIVLFGFGAGADEPTPDVTAYTVAGPTSGRVGKEAGPFVVTLPEGLELDPYSEVEITFSDNGAGGSFSVASVTLDELDRTDSFLYTPAVKGAVLFSFTNDASLDDADDHPFTARSGGGVPIGGR